MSSTLQGSFSNFATPAQRDKFEFRVPSVLQVIRWTSLKIRFYKNKNDETWIAKKVGKMTTKQRTQFGHVLATVAPQVSTFVLQVVEELRLLNVSSGEDPQGEVGDHSNSKLQIKAESLNLR